MYFLSKLSIIIIFIISLFTKVSAIEEAEYKVVEKDEDFELRYYSTHILAETIVDGDMEDAGDKAFKLLFGYISGDNLSEEEVAMTLPVNQRSQGKEIAMTVPVGQRGMGDSWVVSFMMPKSYTMETIPKPTNPKVTLREVPEQYIASIEYSGTWSEENYLENKLALERWIEDKGFIVKDKPTWARYNSPLSLWFLRRNEVLIPIGGIVDRE